MSSPLVVAGDTACTSLRDARLDTRALENDIVLAFARRAACDPRGTCVPKVDSRILLLMRRDCFAEKPFFLPNIAVRTPC